MGRHLAGIHALPGRSPGRTAVAAAGVAVLLSGGLIWWLAGSGDDSQAAACGTTRTVDLSVAPEVGPVVEELLADPVPLSGNACAAAVVRTQQPLQAVGDLGALAADALPDVWVPDSSLWTARVDAVPVEAAGSLATSPVVLATSRQAADDLGWTGSAPDWGAAVTSGLPLVVGDLAASAGSLSALAAVRESLGGDDAADTTVVEAVLAAARGPVTSPDEALAAAATGDGEAPLVPVAEQQVVAANGGAEEPPLVAVYPAEGAALLDLPVVRRRQPRRADRPAVDAVVRVLTSAAAQEVARRAGFRGADAAPPAGAGPATGTREDAPETMPVDPAGSQELLARLASLATPSRLLAVVDVSTSMEAPVGAGTRATLARDSAKSALVLFPPDSAIGLWFFAAELDGDQDWEAVVPTRRLDAFAGGRPQVELLTEQLDALPERLRGGGTGLHDTVLAAVRAAREDFYAAAVNSVVLLTDGTNEDTSGLALDELVSTLEDEADPDRPVKVIGIALGPDADLAALERIAEATDGAAYPAVEETDLQEVLFDALRQRG